MENTIENFIDFCDDMKIANESARSINKIYKQLESELEIIKNQLKKENQLKKMIPLYEKMIHTLTKVKAQISKESENGIGDILPFIKNNIGPIALTALGAGGTSMLIKNKDGAGVACGVTMTALAAIFLKDSLKELSGTKSNILKAIDTEIKACNEIIGIYKECISKYKIYTKDQFTKYYGTRDFDTKNMKTDKGSVLIQIDEEKNNEKLFAKYPPVKEPKEVPTNEAVWNKMVSYMVNDIIKFLKSYVNSPEFKKKYSKYLYMIDIKKTDHGDVFSITFTEYQDGIDGNKDDTNNDWYHEIMHIGEAYIKHRFIKWQGIIWDYVSTGDGDEGTIYVD